jgi:hypothetical protein
MQVEDLLKTIKGEVEYECVPSSFPFNDYVERLIESRIRHCEKQLQDNIDTAHWQYGGNIVMFENGGHFSVVTYRAMKEYLLNKKMTPLVAEQAIRAIPDAINFTDSEKKQMLYHLSEVMLNFTMLPESVIQDLLHWEEPTLGVTKDDIFETINSRRKLLGLPEETEESLMISTMI